MTKAAWYHWRFIWAYGLAVSFVLDLIIAYSNAYLNPTGIMNIVAPTVLYVFLTFFFSSIIVVPLSIYQRSRFVPVELSTAQNGSLWYIDRKNHYGRIRFRDAKYVDVDKLRIKVGPLRYYYLKFEDTRDMDRLLDSVSPSHKLAFNVTMLECDARMFRVSSMLIIELVIVGILTDGILNHESLGYLLPFVVLSLGVPAYFIFTYFHYRRSISIEARSRNQVLAQLQEPNFFERFLGGAGQYAVNINSIRISDRESVSFWSRGTYFRILLSEREDEWFSQVKSLSLGA